MNVGEAIVKGTKGPLKVGFSDGSGCGEDGEGCWILDQDGESVVRGGKDDWNVEAGIVQPVDAALLAHWSNVGPKLLRAIEEAMRIKELWEPHSCVNCDDRPDCEHRDECIVLGTMAMGFTDVIKEASEVKGLS